MIELGIELVIGVVLGIILLWLAGGAICAMLYGVMKVFDGVVSFLSLPWRKKEPNSARLDPWEGQEARRDLYREKQKQLEANLESIKRIGKES